MRPVELEMEAFGPMLTIPVFLLKTVKRQVCF